MDATPAPVMHLIYPGMTRSVPVIVGEPARDTGYVMVLHADNVDAEPVKVHTSRLSSESVG